MGRGIFHDAIEELKKRRDSLNVMIKALEAQDKCDHVTELNEPDKPFDDMKIGDAIVRVLREHGQPMRPK